MTLQNTSKKRKHADASFELEQHRANYSLEPFLVRNNIPTRNIHPLFPQKRTKTADIELLPKQTTASRPQPTRIASAPAAAASSEITYSSSFKKDLSACHICHRKPQKRSDLDSYSNCEGCGNRTCYICIRECYNWMVPSKHDNSVLPMTEEQDRDKGTHYRSFEMQDTGSYRDDNDENEQDKPTPNSSNPSLTDWWKRQRHHRTVICSQCCIETEPEGEAMCLACLAFINERRKHFHH